MPIILDDAKSIQIQAKKKAKPSYFDKELTGAGKSTGLLNKNLKPAGPSDKVEPLPVKIGDIKRTRQDGLKKYKAIPMYMIQNPTASTDMRLQNIKRLPDDAEDISGQKPCWIYVTAAGCILETEQDNSSARKLHTRYYITLFRPQPKSDPADPDQYEAIVKYAEKLDPAVVPSYADRNLAEDYFDALTVYDTIVNAASSWITDLPAALECWISTKKPTIQEIFTLVQRINEYAVELADYWKIYDILKAQTSYGNDFLDKCCDRNLNLRLNNTLQTAETIKSQIHTVKGKNPYTPSGIQPSMEQMAAITSEEPYVIVQSGAGVGKSFTIQHRLRYMEESGEDMSKVVVLSFTNAAADHIHDIAPTVNSKTIASMILDIYNNNFKHKLSQPDTILNMLNASRQIKGDIKLRSVKFKLEDALIKLSKNVNSGMMMLASLAKEHYNELIRILDIIGQTTLELQAAICYTADGTLKEPVIGCNHIIMDEVQDSSIFEFIYIIRYAIRQKSTLYFIGDGSQTLYEFRASNPKAMNCLEGSGLFHCLKLQTNYRSNQNILDFANLSLKEIEANQFAGIQLMANAFHVDRFDQNVQLEYTQAKTKKEKADAMVASLGKAKPWIDDKLLKKEQVCILAYTRKDIAKCKTAIEAMFPGEKNIDITPAKSYNDTFFSKYVCRLGETYTHRTTADATLEITRHMVDNINAICVEYQRDRVKELLEGWRKQYKQSLAAADIRLQTGTITPAAFREEVLQTLIDYEIDHNAILSRVITMKNAQKKEADISSYPFVFSTIHSAKGLEFDNVILIYDEDKSMAEDEKRMYYVALTRARSAEYIIATGCTVSSRIQTAYETMLAEKKKALAKKAADCRQALPGTEPKIRFLLPKINPSVILGQNGIKLPEIKTTKQTA